MNAIRFILTVMAAVVACTALPVCAQDSAAAKRRAVRQGAMEVQPYIEAGQVLIAQFSPADDVVTYSRIAAGVDASLQGRNNQAAVSVRYERRFGWGSAGDGDAISGLARVRASIVPDRLQIEAGALAAQTRYDGNGGSLLGPTAGNASTTRIYSVYAGPAFSTRVDDIAVDAHYRIGYNRVEVPDAVGQTPGAGPIDVFDDSVTQAAGIRAATLANTYLPVGLAASAGWQQEDIANLDQRVRDIFVRADVTVPLGLDLAAVGGAGYENVRISSRDALRNSDGSVQIGPDGRYVTNSARPRIVAYDVDGLIWDAGIIWRPSRRTALEAHVGRRYGSTSIYGSFAWAPSRRQTVNVSIYDGVTGFGGQLNRALVSLPTDFSATRNPLTGNLAGCAATQEGGTCINGALGSIRSATFRARGVIASYNLDLGRIQAGVGAGFDRRNFLVAPGTVLAAANGVVDQNAYLAAWLNGRLDERSGFTTNAYLNWFDSGFALAGDAQAVGASASYYRLLSAKLSATAALAVDGYLPEAPSADVWTASALVGLRYSF